MNRRASASPMNAPEGNMWNIRQGIALSAGVAMTRILNIYIRIIRNIQRRGTVIFNNGAVHETWSDLVDCQR